MDENMLLNLAMDAGELMLESGAETSRVEDTVERILSVKPNSMPEAFVTTTGLFASTNDILTGTRTKVKRVSRRETNLEKIVLVNAMSRNFVEGKINIEEAFVELEKIHNLKTFPLNQQLLSSGLLCFAFAIMFKGNVYEAIASGFLGIVLGEFVAFLQEKSLTSFLATASGAMLVAVLAQCCSYIFNVISYDLVIISCIMLLVPGVPLTNCIRDVMNGDYVSGSARMAEVVIVAGAIAFGVAIAITVFSRLMGGMYL